jgi:hypothetical protein
MNLPDLIREHEKIVCDADSKLAEALQPFVNALCDKYHLNFFSGNGDWYFYYPDGKKPFTWQNKAELKRYSRKLAKALSYQFSNYQEIGSYLEIYAPHKITSCLPQCSDS